MTEVYLLTIPTEYIRENGIRNMIDKNDCKKWIFALEKGKNGLEHWQIRLETSNDEFFDWVKENIPQAHVEKSTSEYTEKYERKEGKFQSYSDTIEIQKVRFGQLRPEQQNILKIVSTQGDRQVDVFLDPKGNHGKSWLTINLWERNKALVVPRASATAEKLSAFVCSAYEGQEYIIIDIPRASKPTPSLYECIEELKDGLVFDHRYSGHTRNVRGAKIIVFTNTPLDVKKLSEDRWRLHGVTGVTLS